MIRCCNVLQRTLKECRLQWAAVHLTFVWLHDDWSERGLAASLGPACLRQAQDT
jgi:hypothetical protein